MENKADCEKYCNSFSWAQRYKHMLELYTHPRDFSCLSCTSFIHPVRLDKMFFERCMKSCMMKKEECDSNE